MVCLFFVVCLRLFVESGVEVAFLRGGEGDNHEHELLLQPQTAFDICGVHGGITCHQPKMPGAPRLLHHYNHLLAVSFSFSQINGLDVALQPLADAFIKICSFKKLAI